MPEKSVEQDVWYLVYFEMKYHSMIDILKIVQKSQSALQETKLFYIIISHEIVHITMENTDNE